MKNYILTAVCMGITCWSAAQKSEDFLDYQKSGTFSKPTIMKNMKTIAIAQNTVFFKTISTADFVKNERNAIGGRKSGGATVKAKLSAFLEFSDEDPTVEDYQKLTDDFHRYLNQKLTDAGVSVVDWAKITDHSFYKEKDKDEEETPELTSKKENAYYKINALKGNTLLRYRPFGNGMNVGFAFMRAKRAADFSGDLKAPVLYLHTVVDFCDILVTADVKSVSKYSLDHTTIDAFNKKYKANGTVIANTKIAGWHTWDGQPMGGRVYLTEKNKTDVFMFKADIPSGLPYATELIKDASKMNQRRPVFGLTIGKKMDLIPVAIVTTKANYLAAAKKALEQFADQWVARIQSGS
ncbi:MAG: hypothetical protein KF880_10075 [Ferruginibacter sp.]|nr:hypothetical protein [Ferruginibacter sp.]